MSIKKSLFSKETHRFKKDDIIFNEHDEGNEMYFIDSGRVKIIKKFGDNEGILTILDAGDFFGEMSLITGNKRTASAIALTDCKLRVMDKKTFEENLSNDTQFAKKLLETLALRIEETDLNLKRHVQRIMRLSQVFKVYG
ncbi:MAG: cyclic nucleotide-binding domain-containing protein [Planctomycetes bacterium]|nr:cyclic nucleotide-binding domain-containing protein [Planctomycetota bacterium]